MSVLSTVTAVVRAYQHHRKMIRTEQLLASLPSEVRKDIGWPESTRGRAGNPPIEVGY